MTGTAIKDITLDDYYSEDECQDILEASRKRVKFGYSRYSFKNHTTYVLLALLFKTGLRISEALSLTTSQIEKGLKNGQFKMVGKGGMNSNDKKKRDKYTRIVTLNTELQDLLSAYLKERETKLDSNNKVLFFTRTGNPINRTDAYKRVKALCDSNGLEFKGVHATRHSLGMKVYKKTKDIVVVQKILGHYDVRTTQVYVKASSNDVRDALED